MCCCEAASNVKIVSFCVVLQCLDVLVKRAKSSGDPLENFGVPTSTSEKRQLQMPNLHTSLVSHVTRPPGFLCLTGELMPREIHLGDFKTWVFEFSVIRVIFDTSNCPPRLKLVGPLFWVPKPLWELPFGNISCRGFGFAWTPQRLVRA